MPGVASDTRCWAYLVDAFAEGQVCSVRAAFVAVVEAGAAGLVALEVPVKPHVGDEADPMDASDSGCLYHGRTMADPRCPNQATRHLMIRDAEHGVISVATCAEHEPVARVVGVVLREHVHEAVCGWPGSTWLGLPENRCVLDDSGVERELTYAHEELVDQLP